MSGPTSILDRILVEKRREVERATRLIPLEAIRSQASALRAPRGFAKALVRSAPRSVIAEVKRASPSAGVIRDDLDPVAIARSFSQAGAAALSVLTDETFFGGSAAILRSIRSAEPELPLLRKDFIVDPYQIWEAKAWGADAVLLIVAALDHPTLARLGREAVAAELDVLIETHTMEELDTALSLLADVFPQGRAGRSQPLLGVNSRDLRTFVTDLAVFERIAAELRRRSLSSPPLLIAESGIRSGADMIRLRAAGASAFLIGESLVRTGDPGENLRRLIEEMGE